MVSNETGRVERRIAGSMLIVKVRVAETNKVRVFKV